MAVIERKIKELSIALEALSRINHPVAAQAFEAVEGLLSHAISEAHKENHPLKTYIAPTNNSNDEIPF